GCADDRVHPAAGALRGATAAPPGGRLAHPGGPCGAGARERPGAGGQPAHHIVKGCTMAVTKQCPTGGGPGGPGDGSCRVRGAGLPTSVGGVPKTAAQGVDGDVPPAPPAGTATTLGEIPSDIGSVTPVHPTRCGLGWPRANSIARAIVIAGVWTYWA